MMFQIPEWMLSIKSNAIYSISALEWDVHQSNIFLLCVVPIVDSMPLNLSVIMGMSAISRVVHWHLNSKWCFVQPVGLFPFYWKVP